MQNVMARAWELYRVARPARWASGDETGVRRFLPNLFRNLLNTAWKEARQEAWHAAQRDAARISRELVEKLRLTNIDIARRLDPEVRAARIRGAASELELLTYAGLGMRISQRKDDLRSELAILEEAHRLETESQPMGIGKTAALAIALSNIAHTGEMQDALDVQPIAQVA